jgi:hypothetical protein
MSEIFFDGMLAVTGFAGFREILTTVAAVAMD